MSVLGLIPARGGSKGIPNKNLTILAGKPLVGWVCEAAKDSKLLDEIIISSDSDKIISLAELHGVSAPFKRPADLAQDKTLVIDVINHAVDFLKVHENKEFDYVCLLQPTSPQVTSNDIDIIIQKAIDEDADTVFFGYTSPQKHPSLMFTKHENDGVDWFLDNINRMSRRQDLSKIYFRSGLAYVFKTEMLTIQKKIYGDKMFSVEVEEERALSIDTPFDLKLAEILLKKKC